MFLLVQKSIRGGICQAVHRYAEANNEYMNNYNKSIKSSYLIYLDVSNLYGWAMSQKLLVEGFKWVKRISKSNEKFIKNYDENSNRRYSLEADVEYLKSLVPIKILHIYQKERKFKNFISLFAICKTKKISSHKSFKTSIKSWINSKKSTQSNPI